MYVSEALSPTLPRYQSIRSLPTGWTVTYPESDGEPMAETDRGSQ